MAKFTKEDDRLIAELGIEVEVKKKSTLTSKEEKIIEGFEKIQKFVEDKGREPSFDHEKDIFERIFAIRLEQIRHLPEDIIDLLKQYDQQELLNDKLIENNSSTDDLDDDLLLEELGFNEQSDSDITNLRHIKPRSSKTPPKEIGQRIPCKDFYIFEPLFKKVQSDIESGLRKLIPYRRDGNVEKGDFFILSGQKVYVADIGEKFIGVDGRNEHRLRVIFDNGVESNQLMHSLKKRLYEDENGRRITDVNIGPLFDDQPKEDDVQSGVIYVCRSKSDHPMIKANQNNIHKIGVTGRDAKQRVSGAENDPTFLFAKAELVATYELFNIERKKLEQLLHSIFASARIKIEIPDRFNKPYHPQEWFLVPLETIEEAIEKIKQGTILNYRFNLSSGALEEYQ
ncbi:hypothetical protein VI34_04485 [Methylophilales bacterium MBRSG12]|uniref:Bacteriophage T5 Orf172 DNA-binding domain-containing protein n=1 Tax=Methylophilales bacterium MBRS-H7 TaxID=1623450 RepID=A0A0H4IZP0_9PROT|nr:hypothetical protein UZ34_05840 [Methylophilales bacterium MBRSF5]AKO65974.1 hypothetical protein VI33_04485 [Methylophilales bacterium MBRS-H7]AKO67294.1 hypothetical protein VI34_04485 [Methylophilales bacterium MBRSG12]